MSQFSSGKHGRLRDGRPWACKNNRDIRYARLEDAPLRAKHYDHRPRPYRPLTNPANPILAGFRTSTGTDEENREFAAWLANDLNPEEPDWRGTPAEIAHARAVLTRLVALGEAVS